MCVEPVVNRSTTQESQIDALNCEIKELQYKDKVNKFGMFRLRRRNKLIHSSKRVLITSILYWFSIYWSEVQRRVLRHLIPRWSWNLKFSNFENKGHGIFYITVTHSETHSTCLYTFPAIDRWWNSWFHVGFKQRLIHSVDVSVSSSTNEKKI